MLIKFFFIFVSLFFFAASIVPTQAEIGGPCVWLGSGICVGSADPENFPACDAPLVEGYPTCQQQCDAADSGCVSINVCDQASVNCVEPTPTLAPGITPTPTSTVPTPTAVIGCIRAITNACTGVWNCPPLSSYPYSCHPRNGWCCNDVSICDTLPPEPTPAPNTSLQACSTDADCLSDYSDGNFDQYCDCGLRAGVGTDPAYCSNSNTGALCKPPGRDARTGVKTPIGCLPFVASATSNDNAAKETVEALSSWAVLIGGSIALFIIIFAALQIVTGSGDPKRTKAGQELLFSGTAGLFFLSVATIILNFLGVSVLGLNLLGFLV